MNQQQKKLIVYTYDLLARRRYTVREMIKKLDLANQKSPEPLTEEQLKEILEALIQANLLNDREFAQFHIDAQVRRKPIGSLKIKKQLQLKGIAPELIEKALNAAHLDEIGLALKALDKKLNLLNLNRAAMDLKSKQKICRYLQGLGFKNEVIYSTLKKANIKQEELDCLEQSTIDL